ncbi:MAG: dihydroorotate dehydrogenase electron transfer subunit [Treponema sp.]|jgi:NAD(P)H-flavin reductase|nr:dihydroorotate dehydrogenase electron transfer subunit [Treponema sp.]
MIPEKRSAFCELINNTSINSEIFRLDFVWQDGTQVKLSPPKAGQFFMVKPKRSAVFLARPISVANIEADTVRFLIARRGSGTQELAALRSGDEAELIGPLGNAWADFLPLVKHGGNKSIALVGGGIGLAPLQALLHEKTEYRFDLYAGFRTGFKNQNEKAALLCGGVFHCSDQSGFENRIGRNEEHNIIIATEDGTDGLKGRIPDFLEPEKHAAVCACGPQPMLKAVAAKCAAAGVPCFISMERRMACGTGACLGCTVRTVNGNRRCCTDGPIFKADEVIFDDE